MIILYGPNEKEFKNNGFGDLSKYIFDDEVYEEVNGIFKFEFSYPMFAPLARDLKMDNTIRVETPTGEQPFFIIKSNNTNGYIKITAYHIFYKLAWELIEHIGIVNLSAQDGLGRILENTGYTGQSNMTNKSTVTIVRYNVVQALLDNTKDNTFISRYGGEIIRDKFNIEFKTQIGRKYVNNPVEIAYAKNLESYEVELDSSNVATRVMPQGFDGLLLPEKYVLKPGATKIKTLHKEYPHIKAAKDGEDVAEDELPLTEAYEALRNAVLNDFEAGVFDIQANYKISHQELSTTEEYKNKAVLETIYLGDEIRVKHTDEDIDILARVISYRWKPTTKEYLETELGNYIPKFSNLTTLITMIEGKVQESKDFLEAEIDLVTALLNSALGGHIFARNGELFIMDTDDPMTAQKIWRWNLNGLGYSSTGINGPYGTAITMDGTIIGNYIAVNSISAISANFGTMTGGRIQSNDLSSYWDLDSGEIELNVKSIKINSEDVATKGELEFQNDALNLKFSQIGGENLHEYSENLLNRFWTYEGSEYASGYPRYVDVPEYDVNNAVQLRTTNVGDGVLKLYTTVALAQDLENGEPYTMSFYIKNNRTDEYMEVRSNRWVGIQTLEAGETKKMVFSGVGSDTEPAQIQLRARGIGYYIDCTVWHVKLERGWVATEYSTKLYTGITKIDREGVTVGREGETIESNFGFDGVRINDGATEIASFTGSGAVIKSLDASFISGDVINIMSSSMTFDVGSRTGYYADFSEVLGAIGNRKHLASGVKLTINIRSVLNETIRIEGFSGSGEIELNIYSRVNGNVETKSNSCFVGVYGKNSTHVVNGSGQAIVSSADSYAYFNGLNVNANSGSSGKGITSQRGSNVYVENCDIINVQDALYASSSGKLQALNNKGNVTRYAALSSFGRIWLNGTVPDGGNYGFVYNFETITRTPSSFSPPPTQTVTETRTFNQTDIYTYSVKYGARSSHYGKAAAQNRWDTSMTQMKGRIVFGSSVYSFISGRNSGTTPTVKIRLRRQNSSHGASASVKPTPEWSGAPSFGGATRGNWTPWVTIPYTLFTSSGYTFSFYNGTTGNSYAIWDRAEVQITRTITQ